jgi:heme-degrading monooxygenase HmoA
MWLLNRKSYYPPIIRRAEILPVLFLYDHALSRIMNVAFQKGCGHVFVVMNRLKVPADYRQHLEKAFGESGQRMKNVPGCLEYQFLVPTEGDEYIVYTKWESQTDYTNWTQSEAFKQAHARSNPNSPVASDLRTYEVKFSS